MLGLGKIKSRFRCRHIELSGRLNLKPTHDRRRTNISRVRQLRGGKKNLIWTGSDKTDYHGDNSCPSLSRVQSSEPKGSAAAICGCLAALELPEFESEPWLDRAAVVATRQLAGSQLQLAFAYGSRWSDKVHVLLVVGARSEEASDGGSSRCNNDSLVCRLQT